MTKKTFYHLFIEGSCDADNRMLHAVSYLTDQNGSPVSRTCMSQNVIETRFCTDNQAAMMAFENGMTAAKMAGQDEIVLHACLDIDHDVFHRLHEDKNAPKTPDQKGIDYFCNGVYARRPEPSDGTNTGWQAQAAQKTTAMCAAIHDGAYNAGI